MLCRERGAMSRAWTVDVGAEDQVERAVADFIRAWGPPDGLVANAGIFPRSRALEMQLSEWDRVLRVNLTGTFLCARAAARAMMQGGGGAIVTMASGRALAGAPTVPTIPRPRAESLPLPSHWRWIGQRVAYG
jgi:NAD(P)-dependent dehydrogenase (short-subunit alcohol dehydrogenase family)